MAAIARSWLRSAHLSRSARVISSSSPISVASSNICLPVNGLRRPSSIIASSALTSPMRNPWRAPGSRYGACDIDSMPPPTASSRSPARTAWSIIPTARTLEAHTLLIVSEVTSIGIPASICACRRGIWPCPACSTVPITTCSTCSGSTSARCSASRIATPPRCVAGSVERPPPSLPIGVRALLRITVRGMQPSLLSAPDGRHRDYGRPDRHGCRHDRRRRLRGRGDRARPRRRTAGAGRLGRGQARAAQARRDARRRAALHRRRARRAVGVRSRARAGRRRGGRRRARRSWGPGRSAGRSRTTSPTRTWVGWSRARCWPTTCSASTRADPTTRTDRRRSSCRRTTTSPRAAARRRVGRRRGQRRPRPPEPAGERPHARGAGGARRAAGGRDRRRARPRRDRGGGHGRVRVRRPGLGRSSRA